jgi:hypothetical protein
MRFLLGMVVVGVSVFVMQASLADPTELPPIREWHLAEGEKVNGEPVGFSMESLRIHRKLGDIYVNGTTLREGPRELWKQTQRIAKLHGKELRDVRDLHDALVHEPNATVTLPYAVLECRGPNGVQKIEIHRLRGDSFAAVKKPFDSWLARWQAQIEDQRLKQAESQAQIQLAETQRWAAIEDQRLKEIESEARVRLTNTQRWTDVERLRIETDAAESTRKIAQRIGLMYLHIKGFDTPPY